MNKTFRINGKFNYPIYCSIRPHRFRWGTCYPGNLNPNALDNFLLQISWKQIYFRYSNFGFICPWVVAKVKARRVKYFGDNLGVGYPGMITFTLTFHTSHK